jgi:tRNA A37 methylthiotransferase MiaB
MAEKIEVKTQKDGGMNPALRAEIKTQLVGRTRGDHIVCFDGAATLKGKIFNVRITDARGMTLFGERVL